MTAETFRVKICGITESQQAIEIVKLGASTLGFICVPQSPRYIEADKIGTIIRDLKNSYGSSVRTIGVFADASEVDIIDCVQTSSLSGIQLHGNETIEFCQSLKAALPNVELIKAFRVKNEQTLAQIDLYTPYIDTLLLDAYHPQALGGTGLAWDWTLLKDVKFERPWLLAGGINPDNVVQAIESCHPSGVDLSSGVELSPGIKDLAKVQQLFENLAEL